MVETVIAVFIGAVIAALFARLSSIDGRLKRFTRLEAKVDALLKDAGVTFDEYQDCPQDVREAIERNEMILAIKRYRQATGAGLKEAKEFIDEVRRRRIAAS